MRTIKLLVLFLISVCSYGQSIDNILNSTLIGLDRQKTFAEISNRLDSTWKYATYKDSELGDIFYTWSDLDSIDKYYIKYSWFFNEYDLIYAFNSIEYYGNKTENVFENIKIKFNKYGHLENSEKRGSKVTYTYYVNNYYPLTVSIQIVYNFLQNPLLQKNIFSELISLNV